LFFKNLSNKSSRRSTGFTAGAFWGISEFNQL
jgi:hypothetical protein